MLLSIKSRMCGYFASVMCHTRKLWPTDIQYVNISISAYKDVCRGDINCSLPIFESLVL